MRTTEFLDEFVEELRAQLEDDEERWGDTWLRRTRKGQTARMIPLLNDYFDQFKYGGVPVSWLKVAGGAFINWIRERHPEASDAWAEPDLSANEEASS